MSRLEIRRGNSAAQSAEQAIKEVAAQIAQPGASIVILFVSSHYDRNEFEAALEGAFDAPVIGCTTSGEILSGMGYSSGGLVGVSLASPDLVAHPRLISDLGEYSAARNEALMTSLRQELKLAPQFTPAKMFGLLLVDGLSMLEEQLVALLYRGLEGVHLFGGSAGDDLSFEATQVLFGGRFHSNAAVFTLFETTLPFKIFQIQHFEPTDARLVITESDGANRVVREINGGPAAEEYARAVGLTLDDLNPQIFAAHPVMLKIGGQYYVRSIQKVNPDGSLTFFCAIDDGLVLTVGRAKDLVEDLQEEIGKLRQSVPSLKLILGCDCILRRIELQQKALMPQANQVLDDALFVGFSTYGEQYNGIHVNQTLTGIALGE